MRRPLLAVAAAACLLALGLALLPEGARGDPQGDRALAHAVARGKELFQQTWGPGTKACAECHASGPNKMRAARLKAYPQWDKVLGKVVTGQQKMDQMIRDRAGGQPLGLGSDDLNALEAYLSTLR
jgi:mono/diheme cytochrome c family protein